MKKITIHIAQLVIATLPVAVFASSATDRRIEDEAKASYNYRVVLEDHVKVKANDGVVTLTGTVADKDAKALAEDTVENLSGVSRVKNEIVVTSSTPEHSDAWIALKIRSRLLAKANVSAATTKVDVKDGVVTLSGTAKTAAQKELTEEYAKDIDKVKAVNNQIVVAASSVDDRPAASEVMDDASITTQVKFALMSHRSTSAFKTKVETQNGVVILRGEAASDAEKSLATKLAEGVRGVRSVDNNMTVANER